MLEAQLLASIRKRLKALADSDPTFQWRKRLGNPGAVTGDPDIHGVWRGRPFEMELKRPGESPTLLQQFRLSQWQKAGCRTFVVHSLDELDAALASLRPSD